MGFHGAFSVPILWTIWAIRIKYFHILINEKNKFKIEIKRVSNPFQLILKSINTPQLTLGKFR